MDGLSSLSSLGTQVVLLYLMPSVPLLDRGKQSISSRDTASLVLQPGQTPKDRFICDTARNMTVYYVTPQLHYVPGGHVSGHRGRNVVTVRQRRGTVSTNVSRRDCRGRRGKFLNSQKICHGNHGADDLLLRT